MIPNTNRKGQKVSGEFYALQEHELIALKEAKLINNVAFVHLALRLENPYCDRDIEIVPKEFAKRWDIANSSVYQALGKLEEAGTIQIKSGKTVIRWTPDSKKTDSQQEQVDDSQEEDDSRNLESLQDSIMDSTITEQIMKSHNELQDSIMDSTITENQPPEPPPSKDSKSLRLLQTNKTIQTLSEEPKSQFEIFAAQTGERELGEFLNFCRMKTIGFKKPVVSITDWLKKSDERFKEFKQEWTRNIELSEKAKSSAVVLNHSSSPNPEPEPVATKSVGQRIEEYCQKLKAAWGEVKFRKLVSIYANRFYLDVSNTAWEIPLEKLESMSPDELDAIANF